MPPFRIPTLARPLLLAALALAPLVAHAAAWPDLQGQIVPTDEGRADAAVVIAVEDYQKLDDIAGARVNADDWTRWFLESRGVPASRVFKAYDADATDLKIRELAKRAADSVQAGGTLWFVFIGHGAPSRDGRDGLLVSVDADRSADGIYGRSVPRQDLLALLDAGKQAQTVALLDACFSGQSPRGAALVDGLQPVIPTALLEGASARSRVLTAASSGEFAGPLPGVARPAFSYLALGGLMGWADTDGEGNRDGRVSADEVRAYVQGALNLTVQGRTQTPSLLGMDGDLGRAVAKAAPRLSSFASRGGRSAGITLDTRLGPVTAAAPIRVVEGRYYDATNAELSFDQVRALAAVTPEGAAFERRYQPAKVRARMRAGKSRLVPYLLAGAAGGGAMIAGAVGAGALTSDEGVTANSLEQMDALTAQLKMWQGLVVAGPVLTGGFIATDTVLRWNAKNTYGELHEDAAALLRLANEQLAAQGGR
jgi:uncharacterized caspase-like protein